MLSSTSTGWAPWYVIPADHKWQAARETKQARKQRKRMKKIREKLVEAKRSRR
jgi:polyphosphate kinase 2 (PPK2 family)